MKFQIGQQVRFIQFLPLNPYSDEQYSQMLGKVGEIVGVSQIRRDITPYTVEFSERTRLLFREIELEAV